MSNYTFPITDTITVRRSRHDSTWGVFEVNSAYGYEAALYYIGDELRLSDIRDVATRFAPERSVEILINAIKIVKAGNASMRPRPMFAFRDRSEKI